MESRGLRNLNPGNIRINGDKFKGEVIPSQDKSFKQFESMAYGYRAIFAILNTYRKNGFDTIEKIIGRWAPPNENNTEGYIALVEKIAKVPRTQVLTEDDGSIYLLIVEAISLVENGTNADPAQVLKGFNLQSSIKLR